MSTRRQWQQLAAALTELHRTLVQRARRDYEREHLVALAPGELLRLLTTDPRFEWLRPLSELLVDIDALRDDEAASLQELAAAVRAAVEHFIMPPRAPDAGDAFARHYWPGVQEDPHVAMAHADVKRLLASWPQHGDAAKALHERHLIAEKARHRMTRH